MNRNQDCRYDEVFTTLVARLYRIDNNNSITRSQISYEIRERFVAVPTSQNRDADCRLRKQKQALVRRPLRQDVAMFADCKKGLGQIKS